VAVFGHILNPSLQLYWQPSGVLSSARFVGSAMSVVT
jgi:hypothetical protein